MSGFTYKDIYIEDGQKILEVNILPGKYCNFDCVFCPIGRSHNKGDAQLNFPGMTDSLNELRKVLKDNPADLVYINSSGEALINDEIGSVIQLIKDMNIKVRLLSNGYLLGNKKYMEIANNCDEVIGEIKAITEQDFKKLQRPIEGYSLAEYISNMNIFRKQYKGCFILMITVIKGYNDDDASIKKLQTIINELLPDKIVIEQMTDEKFGKAFGISEEKFQKIVDSLTNPNKS